MNCSPLGSSVPGIFQAGVLEWGAIAFSVIMVSHGQYLLDPLRSRQDLGMSKPAMSLQLCLTLCDPMDCSPPDSSVHGVLQAGILERVAMPFSRASS